MPTATPTPTVTPLRPKLPVDRIVLSATNQPQSLGKIQIGLRFLTAEGARIDANNLGLSGCSYSLKTATQRSLLAASLRYRINLAKRVKLSIDPAQFPAQKLFLLGQVQCDELDGESNIVGLTIHERKLRKNDPKRAAKVIRRLLTALERRELGRQNES